MQGTAIYNNLQYDYKAFPEDNKVSQSESWI